MELFFLGTFAWVDNSWSISGGANLSVDIAKFIQDRFMVGTTHDGSRAVAPSQDSRRSNERLT